ncbi:MAG TPA: AmmeMemoRadiSam system protein B [Burkholderiales bacterium]|nr:AmmeMemoRadiSam system protein B [Burkholderiales bacterium]
MQQIRPPAVAGAFYPADPRALQSQVAGMLDAAAAGAAARPKALIAPHAGYVYSGPTAARAYAPLLRFPGQIRRVVLLGPAHRVRLEGLALPSVQAFVTPLGSVPLDGAAMEAIRGLPQVCVSDLAHAQEHSLEVHLPFLQTVLGSFDLVPLVVGSASPSQVAEVLDRLWGGDETLVVVSSDLSHYLGYEQARALDAGTARRILALDTGIDHEMACGATPVNGLLALARRRGLEPHLLDQCNSGDTAGDRNRVVGYAAFAFYPAESRVATPDLPDGTTLVGLARASISGRFGLRFERRDTHPALDRPAATFVTLNKEGRLRGCIGSLAPHRSLREDIEANAQAAAFSDPRFEPLKFEELRDIAIEVSVLSPMEPVEFSSEAELLAQLKPGEDGLVLQYGGRRGTFLPQVWESLPAPADFLGELKRKAGLPRDFWHPELEAWRYRVDKWSERGRP